MLVLRYHYVNACEVVILRLFSFALALLRFLAGAAHWVLLISCCPRHITHTTRKTPLQPCRSRDWLVCAQRAQGGLPESASPSHRAAKCSARCARDAPLTATGTDGTPSLRASAFGSRSVAGGKGPQ